LNSPHLTLTRAELSLIDSQNTPTTDLGQGNP